MLLNNIYYDQVSIFTGVIFILMLIIGIGVFIFLYKQLKNPPQEKVDYLPDDYDGIQEKNSKTPLGLHLVMLVTVFFSFWYITVGFPLFYFSQAEQYEEEIRRYKVGFSEYWKNADEKALLGMGESIFNTQCVICHGINAEGMNGRAANLIDFGNEAHIIYVMKNGSTGLNKLTPAMPPQYELLGDTDEKRAEAAKNIAAYVMTLSGKQPTNGGDIQAGKNAYLQTCFACHGTDGKGNGPDGSIENFAADLTNYGKPEYIKHILKNGKKGYIGLMPKFDELGIFAEIQYDALSKYIATELN